MVTNRIKAREVKRPTRKNSLRQKLHKKLMASAFASPPLGGEEKGCGSALILIKLPGVKFNLTPDNKNSLQSLCLGNDSIVSK